MARARPLSPLDPLDRLVGAAAALQTRRAHMRQSLTTFQAAGGGGAPAMSSGFDGRDV